MPWGRPTWTTLLSVDISMPPLALTNTAHREGTCHMRRSAAGGHSVSRGTFSAPQEVSELASEGEECRGTRWQQLASF